MKERRCIITKPEEKSDRQGDLVRISAKVSALLDDLAKKSGRPRSYVANRLIEFAYDYAEIMEEEDYDRNDNDD